MAVEIKGLKKIEKELERRFGRENVQRISDNALKRGADVFVDELKSQYHSVNWAGYETGAIIDEITVSEPYWSNDTRMVRVHWEGPKNRFAIVHLNEFGTVNNPNPPAKGTIAKAMRSAEKAYRTAIRKEVEKIARG